HDGEILKFLGDGVLAIFPIGKDHYTAREACTAAITAARNAQQQLSQLRATDSDALHGLEFGIGLHVGKLQFGNIGVPERLQFTVVGPAANEVSRIEDLTKTIGAPIAASRALIDEAGESWHSHGLCELAGTSQPVEIMSPHD
ncbi:MAG: adenylate/guanylate cyclase domain-containing protein, partial [Rhizobiales bacterium]|nr:adenylate/guanylate cyclase domain-containing protein [Hyphomicrobiales bacterium]